jgi:type II secretory pathway component PulC
MARIFLVFVLGASGSTFYSKSIERAEVKKEFSPAVLLDVKIEYVGRFISGERALATLRVRETETSYGKGETISETDVQVHIITPSEIVVERKGVYFTIPFSSKKIVKKHSKGESESPTIRCINLNFERDFIDMNLRGFLDVLKDHPKGILIEGDLPDYNLLGLTFKRGDIIFSLNGQTISDRKMLYQMMQKLRDGRDVLTVKFLRGERELSIIFNKPKRRSP